MLRLLLVASDQSSLADLAAALEEEGGVETSWAKSGAEALSLIKGTGPDLLVTDENLDDMTGLELIRKVLRVNAMINTVAVSRLPEEEFHELSEGLGILSPLPPRPGKAEARELIARLKRVRGLSQDP